jgi:LDH2 family malate/lactate/ureidoglycolate dehydrogenase
MNAPGQVAAQAAVMEAITGARQLGMCAVGVINSNHCGALAFFLRRIAEAGLVGVAASNGPAVMAYFGGRSRAVGTNPLGYSIPRPGGPPIILDMATSNAARGKIISMARSGVGTVPEGWAVDVNGRMTTDPADALAGAVLPFAGPKGSGLAMGIEFLCGTMLSGITGSQIGDMYEQWDRPQRVGHIFFAIDPASWGTQNLLKHTYANSLMKSRSYHRLKDLTVSFCRARSRRRQRQRPRSTGFFCPARLSRTSSPWQRTSV